MVASSLNSCGRDMNFVAASNFFTSFLLCLVCFRLLVLVYSCFSSLTQASFIFCGTLYAYGWDGCITLLGFLFVALSLKGCFAFVEVRLF